MKPTSPSLPKHVGLIPDGTRRWSKKNHVDLNQAYKLAMNEIANFMTIMFDSGVSALSIFLLSKENLARSLADLDAVLDAEIYFFEDILPKLLKQYKVRVKAVGRRDLMEMSPYWKALDKICQETREEYNKTIYLLVAYSPFDEICSVEKKWLTPETLLKHLWVPQPLDLIIRTGGDKRISNFLPLQASYAEFHFIDKQFNDVTAEEWNACLLDYQSHERRFGV
jgi:undecaprenyl diphosphate synthase